MFYVSEVIGMDSNSQPAKFEAGQPRILVAGGLRVYVLYVVNFPRPLSASHEVAWSQTLLADYFGPYQYDLGQRTILVDWKYLK